MVQTRHTFGSFPELLRAQKFSEKVPKNLAENDIISCGCEGTCLKAAAMGVMQVLPSQLTLSPALTLHVLKLTVNCG